MTRTQFLANWLVASLGAALGVATIAKARAVTETPKQTMPTGHLTHR